MIILASSIIKAQKVRYELGATDTLSTNAKKLVVTLKVDTENFQGDSTNTAQIYFTAETKDTLFIARNTPIKNFHFEVHNRAKIKWKGATMKSKTGSVKVKTYIKSDRISSPIFRKNELKRTSFFGLKKKIKGTPPIGTTETYALEFKVNPKGKSAVFYKIDPRITIRLK